MPVADRHRECNEGACSFRWSVALPRKNSVESAPVRNWRAANVRRIPLFICSHGKAPRRSPHNHRLRAHGPALQRHPPKPNEFCTVYQISVQMTWMRIDAHQIINSRSTKAPRLAALPLGVPFANLAADGANVKAPRWQRATSTISSSAFAEPFVRSSTSSMRFPTGQLLNVAQEIAPCRHGLPVRSSDDIAASASPTDRPPAARRARRNPNGRRSFFGAPPQGFSRSTARSRERPRKQPRPRAARDTKPPSYRAVRTRRPWRE